MSILNALMTCDFTRQEKEITCDLVYHSTKYRIPPSRVVFGNPMELDPRPDIEDDNNSYIPAKVDPNFDSRLDRNATGFLYFRIPLGALQMVPGTKIIPPALPFKTSDILGQINAQLKTNLTMNDLEEIKYDSLDYNFIIRASKKSKNWIGSRVLLVEGGGAKKQLFPIDLIFAWLTAGSIEANQKDQLASFANRDNGVRWTRLVDYTFTDMEVNVTGKAGRNSRIYVKALKEGYEDQWLYFVRLDPKSINDQFGRSPIPKVKIPRRAFNTYEILDRINETLGLDLGIDDIENTEYLPGLDVYPIKFKATSNGWLPGIYNLNVVKEDIKFNNPRMIDATRIRMVGPEAYRTYVQE